jgi:predicted ester cyclase
MSDNKALIRKLLAAADANDISVLDEVLAEGYVDHNPPPFQGPATGSQGARDAFTTAGKIFSDWSHEVLAQYSDGDFVITRVVGRGKHTGEFMGLPASNAEVSMEGISIHRVADGKLVEHWGQVDGAGLLMQMGAMPGPPA